MSPSATTPERVSHYRLIELLGRGAMGEVWLAEDSTLPRKVAVKLLSPHLAGDADAVQRMLREAQAAASVDHPAVVTVYEAGLHESRPYIVMQRVEGETLAERLARGPLEIREAIELASRIADALAEVHALGIVHRDLKPANVVLSARGPKLLDFGIASVRGAPDMTTTGSTLGTPLAMSPEQLRGLPPDNRSDLWALGVILYQSLTGRTPFSGASFAAVASAILNDQPPPPGTLREGIGSDLDFMVLKLLRKEPAHRYARAEDLLADLANCEACLADSPAATGRQVGAPRLAVLYFEVLSAEADDAYLAAGLTEDLIVDLTRVVGLQVASRGEVMPYRDRPVPPRTLGRELNAEYVLQGSVRRAGTRARISAALVRTVDGHSIWAERFDRTVEDLFEVQAEVSRRIVEALQVTLKPGEREMLDRAPTRSPEAYAFYLKGRALIDLRTRESSFAAEELLKRALELDPDFALAHAAVGECYVRRVVGWQAGLEVADLAEPHARRALELEPDLIEAHVVLAMLERLRGNPEKLARAIEKILAMDPDHDEALEWLGWSYMATGRPEQAVGLLERGLERRPGSYTTAGFLMSCYEMLGREEDSRRARGQQRDRLLEVLRHRPDNVHARSLLAIELVRLGEIEAGIEQAERTLEMAPRDGRIRYNAACAFAASGMPDRALQELREGIRDLPQYLTDWPRHDPDLASLHGHPEFIRLFGKAEPHGSPS